MKKTFSVIAFLVLALVPLLVGADTPTETPTVTATATPTISPTPSLTATQTVTPVDTATPIPDTPSDRRRHRSE